MGGYAATCVLDKQQALVALRKRMFGYAFVREGVVKFSILISRMLIVYGSIGLK